ncbi:MAG: sigma-70 family RNA polymerase sigma factor [Saprospiraceae bacterium]|nr:sigma-70 family RNA polymerase sigma factor [Saprospiraceae bacterium]
MIDKELHTHLERFKLGDSDSFVKIYNRYSSHVYHFCLSLTKCPQDAEEITSDVFVRIWQKKAIIDTSVCLQPLLIKVTRDLTWNYLKKMARKKEQHVFIENYLNTVVEVTDDAVIFSEYEAMIQQALKNLTPQQRKIFSLRYFTGKDLNQISEELQISKNTVKVHLAKSKRMILHYLSNNAVEAHHLS